MRRIATGNFSQPVHVENRDELGELAGRINRTAQELAKLQEVTLVQERARALRERFMQVASAQEEERRRISRELHDGLGPSLAAMGNRLRGCQYMVDTDPGRAKMELEETAKSLKGHVQEIRELIHGLRPPALDQLGLIGAVKQQTERFTQETGIQTQTSLSMLGGIALDPLTEVTCFRVVQECLTNVQKHSEATEVEVSLQITSEGLKTRIKDNGQGFDFPELGSGGIERGLGLLGMQERAELLGGSLSMQTGPGKGCEIILYIPAREVEVGADSNPTG